MKKKALFVLLGTVLFLLLLAGSALGWLYNKINSPVFGNHPDAKTATIYIDDKKGYANLLLQLDTLGVGDLQLFEKLSSYMKYPENIKAGKYDIKPGLSYLELIRKLRSGNQDPIHFTFNNMRLKEDLVKRVGEQFQFGSDALREKLDDDSVCRSFGFDTHTIVSMFIPNTYEMYWNISVDKFLERMNNEYNRFWNDDRREKAASQSLSPLEVSVLASIVEEETAVPAEYPVVAGLYLNRLKKGMLLQADPTVKFAVGDVSLRRILFKHLETDSPYNTYRNPGLPPGPIRIPSIACIEAVLKPARHDYLFMVAEADFSGKHHFSRTLSEHTIYARKYQDALNRSGIR